MRYLIFGSMLFLGTLSFAAMIPLAQYNFDSQNQILSDSDESTTQNVQQALEANDSLSQQDIEFTVENGKVTLTGTVSSDSQKSMAETVVLGVNGVTWVQNDLIVKNQ